MAFSSTDSVDVWTAKARGTYILPEKSQHREIVVKSKIREWHHDNPKIMLKEYLNEQNVGSPCDLVVRNNPTWLIVLLESGPASLRNMPDGCACAEDPDPMEEGARTAARSHPIV